MKLTMPKAYCAATKPLFAAALAVIVGGLALVQPAEAQYRHKIANDLSECTRGSGPAVMVTVSGIRSSRGTLRVQSYRATAADWLQKGRWINRVEMPARAGTMTFCLPVPGAGSYAIAVRHDANNNGETDLTEDGGGMSNNPSNNNFNLGKPSVRKTAIAVGGDVKSISIVMKYM
jgi:uncharacterized protein (DUF2141 family)